MRYMLTGLLILVAAIALLATGCERTALAPAGKAGDSPRFASTRGGTVPVLPGDVAEVVVTAERPAGLMPEVVARANQMPEVVVHAAWSSVPLALSASPPAAFVN
jgi:hypothetical protein